jgi:hypothetical protein
MKKLTIPVDTASTVYEKPKISLDNQLNEIDNDRQLESKKHAARIQRLDNLLEYTRHLIFWIIGAILAAFTYVVCQILCLNRYDAASIAAIIKLDIEIISGYVLCALITYILTIFLQTPPKTS